MFYFLNYCYYFISFLVQANLHNRCSLSNTYSKINSNLLCMTQIVFLMVRLIYILAIYIISEPKLTNCFYFLFKALKIHLSPTTYDAICQYPGFIVKERGGIEIKVRKTLCIGDLCIEHPEKHGFALIKI